MTTVQIISFVIVFSIALPAAAQFVRLAGVEIRPSTERFAHLDGIRGLAALAVIGCHAVQYACSFMGVSGIPDATNRIGSLGVQMFFALTAFLFTRKVLLGHLDLLRFAAGRIRRIVPLYLASCLFGICLVAAFTGGVDLSPDNLQGILDSLLYGFIGKNPGVLNGVNMISLIGVAWTLSFEWGFYLFVPVLLLLFRAPAAAALAALIAIITAAMQFSAGGDVLWPFFLPGILGAVLIQIMPRQIKSPSFLTGMACVAVAAFIVTPGHYTAYKLFLSTVTFLCLLLGRPLVLVSAPCRSLGQISYSIYLLQYLVIWPFTQYPMFTSGTSIAAGLGFLIALPLMLSALSVLTYQFIEAPWIAKTERRIQGASVSL